MDKTGIQVATPRDNEGCETDNNFLEMQSGYIQRATNELPRQGSRQPWQVVQNYFYDLPRLKAGAIEDGVLEFSDRKPARKKGLVASLLGA